MKESNQKHDQSKGKEILQGLIGLAVIVVLAIIFLPMLFGSGNDDKPQESAQKVQDIKENDAALVKKATEALDKLGESVKQTIASESDDGRQGTITGVVAGMSSDSINVKISTHFENPSEEGRQIAKNIFVSICDAVPELDSLYVSSEASDIDSSSIYRKDIPACRN